MDAVVAFWEGGAAAWDRVDEWSDVDLYVVTADDRVDETLDVVEAALASLSRIRIRYPVPHPPEAGITQVFYRLEGTGPFLLVDLAILKASAPEKYLEPEIHGRTDFIFNKGDAVRIPALDKDSFVRTLRERLERLRTRMDLFGPFLEKERYRGHILEALDIYETILMGTLVEILRMRYGPFHYNFRWSYVHSELPPEVVARLEGLAFVRDGADLEAKARDARAWFDDLSATLDLEAIEARIRRG